MRLMTPLLCFTAVVLVAAQPVAVHASAAEPTPRDIKCQWKKHRKAGRYQACVQNAVVEEVKNPAFELDAAYSGRVDRRFRSKPISHSGMSITSERSDAGCSLLG